jgi:NADH-quinone oxidoreductase subunit L
VQVLAGVPALSSTTATAASLLLLAGVAGKSAQFPLHVWLPDAMAGPSPVSALIHAATMVAAGVYVVIRLYPVFLASELTLTVMAVIACISMLGAALAALAQQDVKRVLAWSTISQLAYMMAALSVGGPGAAAFLLLAHAFFKALLFLSAGALINAVASNSLADMGGLRRRMRVTYACMSVGLLALAGIPPLSGFFAKESVLGAARAAASGGSVVSPMVGWAVFVIGLLTVAVTGAYVARLWLMVFLGDYRGLAEPQDPPAAMRWPLVLLAVPSALLGVVGLASAALPTWLGIPVGSHAAVTSVDDLRPGWSTTAVSLLFLTVGVGLVLRGWRSCGVDPVRPGSTVAAWLEDGFGFDRGWDRVIAGPVRRIRALVAMADDQLFVGVTGVGPGARRFGGWAQHAQGQDPARYLKTALTAVAVMAVIVAVTVST